VATGAAGAPHRLTLTPTTVRLTVVDSRGSWETLVGGGTGGF
jgi:hypothetical protein